MDVVEIRIDEVVWDVCQTRAENNQETIEYYAERMQAGDTFPPIVTFSADGYAPYYCGDGVHRLLAAELAGVETIKARTFQGGRDRARLYSATESNYSNGLPLTTEDKRNRVKEVLSLKPSWSVNKIAQECRVSWHLANQVAQEVGGFEEAEEEQPKAPSLPKYSGSHGENLKSKRVQGADGKSYPARKNKGETEKPKKRGRPPKNGNSTVNLPKKDEAWKLYGQLCRALSELNLDEKLLSEMDAIGAAIKSL